LLSVVGALLLLSCVLIGVQAYTGDRHLEAGDQAMREGDRQLALEEYEAAREWLRWDAEPERRLAHFATDPNDRIEAARRACSLEPTNANNQLVFARAYVDLDQWKLAEGRYREAVRLDPHKLVAWNELAKLRLEYGNVRGAEEAWKRITMIEQSPYNTVPATPEHPDVPAVMAYATAHYWLAVLASRKPNPDHEFIRSHLRATLKVIETYDRKVCIQISAVARSMSEKLSCNQPPSDASGWRQFSQDVITQSPHLRKKLRQLGYTSREAVSLLKDYRELLPQMGYREQEDDELLELCDDAKEALKVTERGEPFPQP